MEAYSLLRARRALLYGNSYRRADVFICNYEGARVRGNYTVRLQVLQGKKLSYYRTYFPFFELPFSRNNYRNLSAV